MTLNVMIFIDMKTKYHVVMALNLISRHTMSCCHKNIKNYKINLTPSLEY